MPRRHLLATPQRGQLDAVGPLRPRLELGRPPQRPAGLDRGPVRPDHEAPLAVDKEPGTDWTTEGYSGGQLGKDGVGIYVDADPGVDARSIAIDTPDPGWKAEIRVADGSSPPDDIAGWQKVAGGTIDKERKRFRLGGERHRYYLVWITGLPPGEERVKIAEITLFAPRS